MPCEWLVRQRYERGVDVRILLAVFARIKVLQGPLYGNGTAVVYDFRDDNRVTKISHLDDGVRI